MRLVGASNFYITVPFLLEAVISALIGVGCLACASHWPQAFTSFIKRKGSKSRFSLYLDRVEPDAVLAMLGVAIVGLILSIIPR